MAGPNIGTWVKVKGVGTKLISNKDGDRNYTQGQTITQSEFQDLRQKRAERLQGDKALPYIDNGESANPARKTKREPGDTPSKPVSRDWGPPSVRDAKLRDLYTKASSDKERSRLIRSYIKDNETTLRPIEAKHGMKDPEEMVSVKFGGIELHYPLGVAGRKNATTVLQEMLQDNYSQALIKHTSSVYLSNQRNKNDDYWEKTYNIPNFRSAATGGKGSVVFYNGRIQPGALVHEMGHNLAGSVYGSSTPPPNSIYAKVYAKEKRVSVYSEKSGSIGEDYRTGKQIGRAHV